MIPLVEWVESGVAWRATAVEVASGTGHKTTKVAVERCEQDTRGGPRWVVQTYTVTSTDGVLPDNTEARLARALVKSACDAKREDTRDAIDQLMKQGHG